MVSLESRIKKRAGELGFELAGIAAATPPDSLERLSDWLGRGYAGEMDYMRRHAEARRDPASILDSVRSVIMVGMNYLADEGYQPAGSPQRANGIGRVARYARGQDYHDVLRERLQQLLAWLQVDCPGCHGRAVVDTAPLLERDFARRAGLGWFGKNTMLINKRLGSYFFLGALLTDLELQPDPAHETSHCGTCTACLDACPTNAFPEAGQLDARRCISYLTIELRSPIPEVLREGLGNWVFGCDICQEVCPWNRKAIRTQEPAFQPRADLEAINCIELLGLSEEQRRRRFRGTALLRAKRRGLLCNAAIVLGNQADPAALPALRQAAADPDPLVQEAARWAIERIAELTSGHLLAESGQGSELKHADGPGGSVHAPGHLLGGQALENTK
jgi:epoxyqueuosine reductase